MFKIFHIFFFEVPSLAELQPDTVMWNLRQSTSITSEGINILNGECVRHPLCALLDRKEDSWFSAAVREKESLSFLRRSTNRNMSAVTPNYKGLKLFAHRLDEQLCDILNNQLSKALEEVESGISERFKPESQAFVMFTYYMLTLFLDQPTPGKLPCIVDSSYFFVFYLSVLLFWDSYMLFCES